MKQQSILAIACGGTGGHFFPGMTIAKEFAKRGGHPLLFIGGRHIEEQIKLAKEEGLDSVSMPTVSLPSRTMLIPKFATKFSRAVWDTCGLIKKHKVNTVLGMGSFASAPLGAAAVILRIPLFLHEGNAVPGLTNRLLSRWCRVIMLSFPLRKYRLNCARQKVVGMPIREPIVAAGSLTEDEKRRLVQHESLDLDSNAPTLMVFGGSQGAQFLNKLMKQSIGKLSPNQFTFQVIHLTGQRENSKLVGLYASKGIKSFVKNYETEMEKLLLLADFVVCRAGASTIFELLYLGKPALYVPLPSAKDDHQKENGLAVVDQGGSFLLEQDQCTRDVFLDLIQDWLNNVDKFRVKGQNTRKLARPNAAKSIVDTLLEST